MLKEMQEICDENICIDYIEEKSIAIFVDEWGTLFYMELPINCIEIGEAKNREYLIPLSNLPLDEQEQIIGRLGRNK